MKTLSLQNYPFSIYELIVYCSILVYLFGISFYSLISVCSLDDNTKYFHSFHLVESSPGFGIQDVKNNEWTLIYKYLQLLPWTLAFNVQNLLISNSIYFKRTVECVSALFILSTILNPILIIVAILLTCGFGIIGYSFRSKFLIWTIAIFTFIGTEHLYFGTILPNKISSNFQELAMVQSTLALIFVRAISVGLEHSNTQSSFPSSILVTGISFDSLLEVVYFALYPPTFIFGPITIFSDWCVWRQNQVKYFIPDYISVPVDYIGCLCERKLNWKLLAWRLTRLIIWLAFWEAVLCLAHPNALVFSVTQPSVGIPSPDQYFAKPSVNFQPNQFIDTDRSALGISVFFIGLQFFLTHMQLYGWSALLSDAGCLVSHKMANPKKADNVYRCLVPDGPPCPFHIFLFSDMWRKFDRGIYNFLKWYVYLPWLKPKSLTSKVNNRLQAVGEKASICQRLKGGILCFSFVLIFHSWDIHNIIWMCINIAQILSEHTFKWMFTNTYFGSFVLETFSGQNIRRFAGLLCSFSAIWSSIGFFYFYLGFESGQWITYWILNDPVYRIIAILVYYCAFQISIETRKVQAAT